MFLGDLVREIACHNEWNSRNSKVSFRELLKDQIASKPKDAFLKIRKIFETCKKKVLKEIVFFFLESQVELVCNGEFYHTALYQIIFMLSFLNQQMSSHERKRSQQTCTLLILWIMVWRKLLSVKHFQMNDVISFFQFNFK